MKKLLVVVLLFILAVGCSQRKPEDFLVTSLGDYNITLYKNLTVSGYIEFDIVSSFKLDDAVILIDIETPYTAVISEKKIEKYPYYVFQNYQDIDWNKMYELHKKIPKDISKTSEDAKAVEEFQNYRDKYLDEFNKKLKNPPLEDCYAYTVNVFFQMLGNGPDEEFDTITLKINDKEIDVNYPHL